ncbi:MAG: U32 family peptidase [Clostridiales bacterium]|nr:U32 family peptidase [Clostridiales bacterium]
MLNNKKIELLAPAGDIGKLDVALEYGADAVYLSGKSLGMRAACKNFDYEELKAASLAAHLRGAKFYVTLNIFPNDDDLSVVAEYLDYLNSIHTDGIIVSDIGLIKKALTLQPSLNVHVSTQANVLNSDTARFYADMGVKRIVLARELSLKQIRRIRDSLSDKVELEAFVHGAMCISYSGRCLLSAYMSGRSANRGECNQACRMYFTPENNGEPFEFIEDDGTYIFGGNDLNMVNHLKDVTDAGVTSLKIEGRVKSEYYVGCVVNAYRRALNALYTGETVSDDIIREVQKAPNRGFNTGFYYGQPVRSATTVPFYDFCGLVRKSTKSGCVVEMRNRFKTGDKLEVLSPDDNYHNSEIIVPVMLDEEGNELTDAKVTRQLVTLSGITLPPLSMLRRPQKSFEFIK